MLNLDVKYLWMSSDINSNNGGAKVGDVTIDPWVSGIGIRYKF